MTRFPKYNPMGQVLQSIDPNGVTTDYEYDPRQRLTRQTTAGQSTTYEYWPTGLIKRVTQPDLSYVGYEYDPAQRLVAVADNLGNRVEYTLDNSGRQREERVKDPAGTLKRQVSRVFDALGRAQQVTGRVRLYEQNRRHSALCATCKLPPAVLGAFGRIQHIKIQGLN